MNKKGRGGTYCCLPGCTSSTVDGKRLYKIPVIGGRRFGVDTTEWASRFHQVVFKYRDNAQFRHKVRNGKAHICEDHFESSDIQATSHKSFIKIGCLPSVNLPVKSHSSRTAPRRREIFKHELPSTSSSYGPQCPYSILEDVLTDFSSIPLTTWRVYEATQDALHFTCYTDCNHHAIARISLLLSHNNEEFKFSVAFSGVYAPHISASLSFASGVRISALLDNLSSLNICQGYGEVHDTSEWVERQLLNKHNKLEKRYMCTNCDVAHSQTELKVCATCMKHHVKCVDNMQRRITREEEIGDKPLKGSAPLQSSGKQRLIATISEDRQKIRKLEKECIERGVTIPKSLSSIIDSISAEDGFLKEWWNAQKNLQQSHSKHANRYPPSVIRYCLMIHSKSPATYRLFKKVLVLPAERTLRHHKRNILDNCHTGFQSKVAERIHVAVMEARKECDKLVVLCFDEMTIKEDIVFRPHDGEIVGYVDYGDDTLTTLSSSSDRVASHMLAVFVRGITNSKLDGVVAFYPTTGACADDLFFLINDLLVEVPFRTGCTIVGMVE